jgi:Coenzyme PQQ synthesis protein D (PqqD)
MITPSSRPRLVPGLQRRRGQLFDRAMRRRIEVNGVGEFIVGKLDGAASLSQIAGEVSAGFGVGEQVALADVISFVEMLERYDVVRSGHPPGYYLKTLAISLLAPSASSTGAWRDLFSARQRVDVRGKRFAGILAQVSLRILLRHSVPLALLMLVSGAFIFALTRDLLSAVLIPAAVYVALLLGVSLHESAHLYALRRRTANAHLGYLRLTPIEMGVTYPSVRPAVNFRVAMAGPLCPAVCGAVLYLANAFYPNPFLALGALLLVAHVLSFLPLFASDGRHLLSYAIETRDKEERW